jgi:predicted nucleotidyltransferase
MAAASAETRGAAAGLAVSAVETSAAAEPTVTGDVGGKVEAKLTNLVERMKAAFSRELKSAILYGSAAMDDWHEHSSDLNVLCVLNQVTARELAQSEPVFRWWREQGNPPPLLMSDQEVRTSTDCFPMEFHDMQAHRRVLYGDDVIAGLTIDRSFYRAQVEHELRAKQIRLRQKAAELLIRPAELMKLLTGSISTFCVLGRHALLLSGRDPHWKKREILVALTAALNHPFLGASAILSIRAAGKTLPDQNPVSIFEQYLDETDALVRFVDALDR